MKYSQLILDNNTDILLLTETWLRPSDKDSLLTRSITPNGYQFLFVSREKKKGGGVGSFLETVCASTTNNSKVHRV